MSAAVYGGANGSLTTVDTAFCKEFGFAIKPAVDVSEANPVAKKIALTLPAPLLQRHRRWLKAGLGYLQLQR
jgi:hypothetical protein